MAISRWIAPAALAASLALGAFTPAPAHAQSSYELTRAIVDIADVVFRGNQPYYRYGNYGQDDRLVMSRDRYGRPVYYRVVRDGYRSGPPYGRAYGYYGRAPGRVKCNNHGKCKAEYYDARYDRHDRYGDRYDRYDRDDRDDRRWRGY